MAMRKVAILGNQRVLITAPYSEGVGLIFSSWLAAARWAETLARLAREAAARDKEPEVKSRWKRRWIDSLREPSGELSREAVQVLLDYERDQLWQKFSELGPEGSYNRKEIAALVKEQLQRLAREYGFQYERGRLSS